MLQLILSDWTVLGDFVVKIIIAAISGLVIGLEREVKGKSAGLKTNALVSIGAAVFILASLKYAGQEFVDTTRVLSQVVAGIGFLGAGVILQQKDKIKGLTTAATIWCSAGVGCLSALGLYAEVIIVTVLVVTINIIFSFIDRKISEWN